MKELSGATLVVRGRLPVQLDCVLCSSRRSEGFEGFGASTALSLGLGCKDINLGYFFKWETFGASQGLDVGTLRSLRLAWTCEGWTLENTHSPKCLANKCSLRTLPPETTEEALERGWTLCPLA